MMPMIVRLSFDDCVEETTDRINNNRFYTLSKTDEKFGLFLSFSQRTLGEFIE